MECRLWSITFHYWVLCIFNKFVVLVWFIELLNLWQLEIHFVFLTKNLNLLFMLLIWMLYNSWVDPSVQSQSELLVKLDTSCEREGWRIRICLYLCIFVTLPSCCTCLVIWCKGRGINKYLYLFFSESDLRSIFGRFCIKWSVTAH